MLECKFKIGDRVRIWDRHTPDIDHICSYVSDMVKYAGMEATIVETVSGRRGEFRLDIDSGLWNWASRTLTLIPNVQGDDQCDSSLAEISIADLEAILGI